MLPQTSINTDFLLSITSNPSFTESEFHYSTCQMSPETTWKNLIAQLGVEATKILLCLHKLNYRTQLDDLLSPWALLPTQHWKSTLCVAEKEHHSYPSPFLECLTHTVWGSKTWGITGHTYPQAQGRGIQGKGETVTGFCALLYIPRTPSSLKH